MQFGRWIPRSRAAGLVSLVLGLLPALAPAAPLPALKDANLTMRLGQRLSYISASATVGRSGLNLIPDANGNWVSLGAAPLPETSPGTGGLGVSTIDICQFNASTSIANQTTYLVNTVTNSVTLASRQVLVGTSQVLAEIWARPANFAAYPDQNIPNLRVKRLKYTLDGRTFNAIRIQQNTGNGWTQSTYDLASGFLIIKSYAIQISGGGTGLAYFRITSGKLLAGVPGINTAWPASLREHKTYNWLASGTGGVFGAGGVSGQVPFKWLNMKWSSQTMLADVNTNGKAQGQVRYVAGTFGAPWMSATFLQSLKLNQTIDEEPAIQYRIFVSSVDATYVSLKFANKTQNIVYKYKRATGDLVSFNVLSTEGIFGSAATVTFVSRQK